MNTTDLQLDQHYFGGSPSFLHFIQLLNGGELIEFLGRAIMDIIISSGVVVGAFSFTTGFVPRKCTTSRMSENDVLARALWLERHGRHDEAEMLISRWSTSYAC